MSVVTHFEAWLCCDSCGTDSDGTDGGEEEAIEQAEAAGWVCIPSADLCPECASTEEITVHDLDLPGGAA